MDTKKQYEKHYEESVMVTADAARIFIYADDHTNFSSHMNKSSWMMGGGKMETTTDEGKGQRVGSHIQMGGKVFGIHVFLDEVITIHEPPYKKAWKTVGSINLLIIDHYTLGFEIIPQTDTALLRVYIDYNLPQSAKTRWLGVLLGTMYAKWCVTQMTTGVRDHFKR